MAPRDVLSQVARALPEACRQDVIIIGSLAAGYFFFADDGDKSIRTKDVDCMFSPHAKAVVTATQVTEDLLAAKWQPRQGTAWNKPGSPADPTDKLPLVRLKPPGGSEWFVELLGAPDERANKDLGRVLVLAYLTVARDRRMGSDEFDAWPNAMWAALQSKFPAESAALAQQAGTGVRALLASPEDLDQALAIANLGLLASMNVHREAFAATGRRFLSEVIEPLADLSRVR